MKKKVVLGITVISLFMLSPIASAQALDLSSTPWEVSGQIGAAFPTDEDTETGMLLLGRVTYDLTPNIAIGASTGWTGSEVTVDSIELGDTSSIPLLANVVFRLPIPEMENRLVPYLVGGMGVVFWSFDESSVLTSNGASFEDETAFAFQIGAGVDYFFNDKLGVFGEVSYIFNEVDTSFNAGSTSIDGEIENDAIYLGAGLKARF